MLYQEISGNLRKSKCSECLNFEWIYKDSECNFAHRLCVCSSGCWADGNGYIVISVIKPELARPSILCFLTLIYFVPEVGVCPPRLSYLFWKCNKQWGLNPGDLKERYKLHMSFDIKQLYIATAVNKSHELN